MSELIQTIKKVLSETELVLGWTADDETGVAAPAVFKNAGEAESGVFDSTCVHNLAVHLPRLSGRRVGIVAKGCDARSIVELIVEGEVARDMVRVIAVPCPGMVDVKKVWRCFGYGTKLRDSGGMVEMEGKTAPREEILLAKCRGCRDQEPVIFDEIAGDMESVDAASPAEKAGLRERFAAMAPVERRDFWQEQFSRCIRCYACREACPLCYCRDVCTMQTQEPHWTGGEVDAEQSGMAQMIRLSHMAGRCTGCGECERACPVGIPLMLLVEEQNRAIEEMFNYQPGMSLEARPPLQTFDIKGDSWGEGR